MLKLCKNIRKASNALSTLKNRIYTLMYDIKIYQRLWKVKKCRQYLIVHVYLFRCQARYTEE